MALTPAKTGTGDIIILTASGDMGTSSVQVRIFTENVGLSGLSRRTRSESTRNIIREGQFSFTLYSSFKLALCIYIEGGEGGPAYARLTDGSAQGAFTVEQQKKLIQSLTQMEIEGDPAWECVQTTKYRLTCETMDNCKNKHATLDTTSALRPAHTFVGLTGNASPAR